MSAMEMGSVLNSYISKGEGPMRHSLWALRVDVGEGEDNGDGTGR